MQGKISPLAPVPLPHSPPPPVRAVSRRYGGIVMAAAQERTSDVLLSSPPGVVKIRVSAFSETKTPFQTTKTCLKTKKNIPWAVPFTCSVLVYARKIIIIAFLASARAVRREVGLPCFSYYYSSLSTARGYRANTRWYIYIYNLYIILFTAAR